jgi:hypothetical protein
VRRSADEKVTCGAEDADEEPSFAENENDDIKED